MSISHDSMNDVEKNNCEILTKQLSTFAKENKFFLGPNSQKLKDRKKKTVASTFHGLGIVVPVENDVGYRSIGETDGSKALTFMALFCRFHACQRFFDVFPFS